MVRVMGRALRGLRGGLLRGPLARLRWSGRIRAAGEVTRPYAARVLPGRRRLPAACRVDAGPWIVLPVRAGVVTWPHGAGRPRSPRTAAPRTPPWRSRPEREGNRCVGCRGRTPRGRARPRHRVGVAATWGAAA